LICLDKLVARWKHGPSAEWNFHTSLPVFFDVFR
jgi:hypothetical protein